MNIPYVFKKCTKCGEWLVACKVNFYKGKSGKYGLEGECKKCRKKRVKDYYENNKDNKLKYNKYYYENNKDKIAKQKKEYYENNRDKISEYRDNNRDKISEYERNKYKNDIFFKNKRLEKNKKYYKNNKYKICEYHKQYYKNNNDEIKEKAKLYYIKNKNIILEKSKEYRSNNKDKISEQYKKYYKTPKGQVAIFNCCTKRRLRKENQGDGITKEQWLECMKFFEFRCAYSGVTLTKENRSLDHVKPLNQGGEHEIWNVVPMYKNYNFSKQDKDMLEWYKQQEFYSEERLKKIRAWQEYAYNKWGRENITNGYNT